MAEDVTKTKRRLNGRRWYENNRELTIRRAEEWRTINRERANQNAQNWRVNNPEKRALITLRSRLKRKFQIDPDIYFRMLEDQSGVCAICKQPEDNSTGKRSNLLCVDHNHTTGKIRGLLCKSCNLAIGSMKDSVDRLSAAIHYLKERS